MYTLVLALHVFVCFLLIISVLLQSGKGGDIGSALGGGSSSEFFGPGAPANIMSKVTTVIAALFIVLSLTLAIMSNNRNSSSVLKNIPVESRAVDQNIPAAPVAPAATPTERSVNK